MTRRVPAGIGPTGVPSVRIGPTILRYASSRILWQCPAPQAPTGTTASVSGAPPASHARLGLPAGANAGSHYAMKPSCPHPWQVTICGGQGARPVRGERVPGCRPTVELSTSATEWWNGGAAAQTPAERVGWPGAGHFLLLHRATHEPGEGANGRQNHSTMSSNRLLQTQRRLEIGRVAPGAANGDRPFT